MGYEQKNNQGSMFLNDKQGNESRPDWRGSITVNGVEYWCSAWNKATRDGKKWLSLSVKPKEERPQTKPANSAPQRDPEDPGFGEDLPF